MKLIAIFSVFLALALPAYACGADSDCEIGDRFYRIYMPVGHDGASKVGAIVFNHGYRGTAAGIMRNGNIKAVADELGVALIATKSARDDWAIPGAPSDPSNSGEKEFDYFDNVIADAAARFPIDTDKLMATGFSAGGMMTWNLACHRSESFNVFVPISGTFWDPVPQTCSSPPTSILHIHGDADRTVPLMGRPIAQTKQGEVPGALDMYAEYGAFAAASESRMMDMGCELRENAAGDSLGFCLFEGGHSFKSGYLKMAWEMFEAKGTL
ncbi:MAG: prolyl oligopeptidase family serine peptidase [Pseudomonadota bacterium]